jgi:hypothetical protein
VSTPGVSDEGDGRDWNALLERVLAPFRSEAGAFRFLLGTIAVFGTLLLLIVLIRLIT